MRQQELDVRPLGVRLEQPRAAGGDHHRVDDELRQPAVPRRGRATASTTPAVASMPVLTARTARSSSTASTCATTKSAGTAWTPVTPRGVLRGQRGDGAGAEDPQGGEGLEVGLDAGAAAGVGAGDGQRDARRHDAAASSARTTSSGRVARA